MKFKKIPKEYFPTILDRLTRLEPACVRYKRVFEDIINKFSLEEKAKNLSLDSQIAYVEEIFNSSLNNASIDFELNKILMDLEEKYFNFNSESYQYLSARINIKQMINECEINENSVKNLVWLKKIANNYGDIYKLREKEATLYPIEKIILCEGQTEYTLLETIFQLYSVEVNKNGWLIIAAGGKNQVARKYYQMCEYTKTPFYILLDKDAQSVKELVEAKLRENDRIYLINSGEFEDLIPKHILQKTINTVHCNDLNCIFDDFNDELSMVQNLENIYKKYGFGEFKKAKFALELKEYIKQNCTKADFTNSEIIDIIQNIK